VSKEGIFDPSLQHVKRYGGIYQGGIRREVVWAVSDSHLFFFFIFHFSFVTDIFWISAIAASPWTLCYLLMLILFFSFHEYLAGWDGFTFFLFSLTYFF